MALNYKNSLTRYRRYLLVSQQQPIFQASLYVVLSLILVIVLLISALRPTLITIAGLLGQINQNKVVEKQLDEKIVALQQAIDVLQRAEPKLGVLEEAIPTETMWGRLAGEVGLLATESGVALRSIVLNTAKEGEGDKLIVWNFTLTGEGSWTSVRKFVTGLEKKKRVIVISSLDIIGGKEGGVTLSLAGKTAFLPDSR